MNRTLLAVALTFSFVAMPGSAHELSKPGKQILDRIEKVEKKLENLEKAILLTNLPCDEIGKDWKRFTRMDGRFPIATGMGVDKQGRGMKFELDAQGGEYKHVLSIDELPIHTHQYFDTSHGAKPEKVDYGDDRAQEHRDHKRKTEETGGDQPHNNIPPYLALNFCYKTR